MDFYHYPPCSTCQKAKKHLLRHNLTPTVHHIKEQPPSVATLRQWVSRYRMDIRVFFNTRGESYRALDLKNRYQDLSFDELLTLLSQDGMLLKRPILVTENTLLLGYNSTQYDALIREVQS
jgi:arsenate reductase